jgi:hypothetical protein
MRPLEIGGKALTTALTNMVDQLKDTLSDYEGTTSQTAKMANEQSQHAEIIPRDLEIENERLRHEIAEVRSNVLPVGKIG